MAADDPDGDKRVAAILAQAASLSPSQLCRVIGELAGQLAAALEAPLPGAPAAEPGEEPPAPSPVEPPGLVLDDAPGATMGQPAPATSSNAAPALQPFAAGATYEAIDQSGELIVPHGIDPTTGAPRYRLDLAGARRVAAANRWADGAPERALHRAAGSRARPDLGVVHGFSYDTLATSQGGAGWGLVVAANEDTAILKALAPLISKRCEDQGLAPPPLTFRAGETCGAWLRRTVGDAHVNRPMQGPTPVPIFLYDAERDADAYHWCARHEVRVDSVEPRRGLPYYLLLAGRPGARAPGDPHIPFSLQYDLDFHWGVGRVGFTDATGDHRYEAYSAYAEQVVAVERGQVPLRDRSIAYIATRHELDKATNLSSDGLVRPLREGFHGQAPLAQRFRFGSRGLVDGGATRDAISRLLTGREGRPGLILSATHGIELPFGHPDLVMQQGALLCQDWTGYGPAKRSYLLAGEDLPDQIDVVGLIGVCFACFSAGCPSHDQFRLDPDTPPHALAPYPFLAQLPQRLLERGALAVLGHVDRAWTYSFREGQFSLPAQAQAFEDLLGRIMDGKRLGEATDQLNTRQGLAAMRLTDWLDAYRHAPPGAPLGLQEIGPHWVAFQDARGYSLLGDPAVRLSVAA